MRREGSATVDRPPPGVLLDRIVNSRWNYWASLVGDGAACLLFAALSWLAYDGRPFGLGAAVAGGYVFWTALEYALHRFILHGPPSGARRGHARHHRDAEALLATPALFVPLVAVGLWSLLRLLGPADLVSAFLLGATCGYLFFGLLHHVDHHGQISIRPLRRLREHHDIHHRQPIVNFGTTTTVWDRLFGTYMDPREAAGRGARAKA